MKTRQTLLAAALALPTLASQATAQTAPIVQQRKVAVIDIQSPVTYDTMNPLGRHVLRAMRRREDSNIADSYWKRAVPSIHTLSPDTGACLSCIIQQQR